MNWKLIKLVSPVLLGAIGGLLYFNFIGCNGSCAITGSPYNSTAYGTLIGAVLTDWKKVINLIKNKGSNDEEKYGNN